MSLKKHAYKQHVTMHALLMLLGFSAILLIFFSAAYISLNSLSIVTQRMEHFVEDNSVKSLLFSRLGDLIRDRMLAVHHVTNLTDPLDGESIWEELNNDSSEFIHARNRLYGMNLSAEERLRLDKQKPLLAESQRIMGEIMGLVREDKLDQARHKIEQAQKQVQRILQDFDEMRDIRQRSAHAELNHARTEYQDTRSQVIVLTLIALMSSLAIAFWVGYKIAKQSEALGSIAEQLVEANSNLETTVASRTKELVEARDQAMEASRTKSRFLANMSHELRTPLNAIIGYSEIIREEAEDLGHDYAITDLDKVISAAKNLLKLVSEVLDIAKIEAGKMEISPSWFNLERLLGEVIDIVRPLAEQRHNQFELIYDSDITKMYADDVRIRQILYNLLSNACKFTEDGKITLIISHHTRDDKTWMLFQVNDTGIGLSEEQKKDLFKSFCQVDDSSTRRYDGSGLGLVISLRFCQLMGGTIDVASELGKGCNFSVWLPREIDPDIYNQFAMQNHISATIDNNTHEPNQTSA